jgi:hypothetical protein
MVVPAGSGIEINRFVGVFVQFVLLRQIVRRRGVTRLHLIRLGSGDNKRRRREKKKTRKKEDEKKRR